jgi:cyclopropane fatty-acyl-phospholipid synthase-like methyltransferase
LIRSAEVPMATTGSNLDEQIADALECEVELLRYMPELLEDLTTLGSDSELVVRLLRDAGVGATGKVLDLGCGKGAVSIAVARALGATVLGVDGFEPFVERATAAARAGGVETRCCFRAQDLRDVVSSERGYDAVLLLSVGRPFGTLADTVGAVRACARPGGLLVINDAFLADAGAKTGTYEDYGDHDTTIAELTAHGDTLVAEDVPSLEDEGRELADQLAAIQRRAQRLVQEHPDDAAAIRAFVERQAREIAALMGPVRGATWMLRIR